MTPTPAPVEQSARPAARPAAAASPENEQGFGAFGFVDRLFGPAKKPQPAAEKIPQQIKIKYPVNLVPAGEQEPNIEFGGHPLDLARDRQRVRNSRR